MLLFLSLFASFGLDSESVPHTTFVEQTGVFSVAHAFGFDSSVVSPREPVVITDCFDSQVRTQHRNQKIGVRSNLTGTGAVGVLNPTAGEGQAKGGSSSSSSFGKRSEGFIGSSSAGTTIAKQESGGAQRPPPPQMPPIVAQHDVAEAEAVVVQGQATNQSHVPSFDFGATTWLSNDDSMSLAGAQRMLFAMEREIKLSPSEVRPHELLNYFSFDTLSPRADNLFSVSGAAVDVGSDSMALSLAVKGSSDVREPVDLTMVLDRSGSMSSEGRMSYTKRGLGLLVNQLREGDRLDIVLFDNDVCTPVTGWVAGRDDPAIIDNVVSNLSPRGSTNLDAGLREGYRIANTRSERGRSQRVMLLTDAFLNTGNVNSALVSEVAKQFDNKGIRLTGVGVGRNFNDKMLNVLTEKGKGAYVYLGSEAVVDRLFGAGFDALIHTIAHDVRFELSLPKSLALERFYGEESSADPEAVQPIHYYAGTTQLFLQDLKKSQNVRSQDKVGLTIHYTDAVSGRSGVERFSFTVGDLLRADARNTRKAQALMAWADMFADEAMGGSICSDALPRYRKLAAGLPEDGEISWVSGLIDERCGAPPKVVTAHHSVPVKVKIDSDIPLGKVSLTCAGVKQEVKLRAGEGVARFEARSGACTVGVFGTVQMRQQVKVPSVGGDIRCLVRGGRMSCD